MSRQIIKGHTLIGKKSKVKVMNSILINLLHDSRVLLSVKEVLSNREGGVGRALNQNQFVVS